MNQTHPSFIPAMRRLLDVADTLDEMLNTSMIVLRDFISEPSINEFFHNHGFIKVEMPESCILENLTWKDTSEYLATLSARSRKHFRADIQPYEKYFDIEYHNDATEEEIEIFHELYENVRSKNLDLNTFSFPKKLFSSMAKNSNWEFIVAYLKKEYDTRASRIPVGVMFCYKNMGYSYVPSFIGMDYNYIYDYQIYRQLLYQTILRARQLNFQKIDLV
jgi:predicted N-acyltransferase